MRDYPEAAMERAMKVHEDSVRYCSTSAVRFPLGYSNTRFDSLTYHITAKSMPPNCVRLRRL